MGKSKSPVTTFFRQIADAEVDNAHDAYLGVFEWLNAKGVRQWLRPLSRDTFTERQRRGELFAHHVNDHIAAVVTLAFENNSYWAENLGEERRWWIKSLAVVRKWHGTGIGEQVMQACETTARHAGATEIFLDCVDAGFLPDYYARLGYEEIGRKDITYPSGNTFLVALMRKEVLNQPLQRL